MLKGASSSELRRSGGLSVLDRRYCGDPDPGFGYEPVCLVAGCLRPVRCQARPSGFGGHHFRYCNAHDMKRRRLGSPTARKCLACGDVVDDEQQETSEVSAIGRQTWRCNNCILADRKVRIGSHAKRRPLAPPAGTAEPAGPARDLGALPYP